MAKYDTPEEISKRVEAVLEGAWNHITPGTPDHAYVQKVKQELRDAILPPPPAQPATTLAGEKDK
jgi:hypothetical protein